MNYNAMIAAGYGCVSRIVSKVDKLAGKAFVKAGDALAGSPKITQDLANALSGVGVNVGHKNTRRVVEAALKNQVLAKMDGVIEGGAKFLTLDPSPGLTDVVVTGLEGIKACGIKNTGFAKSADCARNMLAFRHENLSPAAQEVISQYLRSPQNLRRLYGG